MAERAPEPEGDLVQLVAGRRRRRTCRRLRAVLAAAAVVGVIGAGTALTAPFAHRGGEGRDTAVARDTGMPDDAATRSGLRPGAGPAPGMASEVWPAAVTTMPAESVDGWRYRPVTALGPAEMLLTAESSLERAARLEIYDTRARQSRVLGEMPAPPGVSGYFPQDVEVGPDHIAWYGTRPNDDAEWADLWVMPRGGGMARQIAQIRGPIAKITQIAVTTDHIIWSVTDGQTLYRVPLSGGGPETMAGTDGLTLYAGSWAHRGADQLVNLETWESVRPTDPSGVTSVRCGVEWCIGRSGAGLVTFAVDGTGRRGIAGAAEHGVAGGVAADIHGRFVEIDDGGPTVFDMSTGKRARLGTRNTEDGYGGGSGTSSSPTSVLYWPATRETSGSCLDEERGGTVPCPGAEIEVLNLLAVPGD
ncbi:hypothetical protein DP939_23240 [Spongiactinospora rosea]|uniref:Uncharacterized protein n=2 Tax=Spongiactinospora rosea TaxID=2248750 RepID=A0A366LV30_9ACTN|nr:hypothetical protein DP939_23240 [Spongiactinospora rosea]